MAGRLRKPQGQAGLSSCLFGFPTKVRIRDGEESAGCLTKCQIFG